MPSEDFDLPQTDDESLEQDSCRRTRGSAALGALAILRPICHIPIHDDTQETHLPFPLTTLPGSGRQAMCIRESDNSKEI
jgi:hypothetical protein